MQAFSHELRSAMKAKELLEGHISEDFLLGHVHTSLALLLGSTRFEDSENDEEAENEGEGEALKDSEQEGKQLKVQELTALQDLETANNVSLFASWETYSAKSHAILKGKDVCEWKIEDLINEAKAATCGFDKATITNSGGFSIQTGLQMAYWFNGKQKVCDLETGFVALPGVSSVEKLRRQMEEVLFE